MACMALAALLIAGCAAPSLRFYTLGRAPATGRSLPLPRQAAVIEVDRLILPNYLDSQDILLSDGSILQGSSTGRWASRLSLLATELVTSRLAMRVPDDLVTDQRPAEAPQYRILIHVARLDITKDGRAAMDADWRILTSDREGHATGGRAQIRLTGSTATDRDTVHLERALFERLADSISLPTSVLNPGGRKSSGCTEIRPVIE